MKDKEKSNAERIASFIEKMDPMFPNPQAAAELRRLHGVNQELVKILEDFRDSWDCDEDAHKYGTQCRCCSAEAALAKAEVTK